MGVFEMSSFEHGTKEVAIAVGKATTQGAFSCWGRRFGCSYQKI